MSEDQGVGQKGTMTMLVDHQIAERLAAKPPLATEISTADYQTAESQIQAASLDLTIGKIFVPGTKNNEVGGAGKPRREITLAQGHTAVLQTKEELNLGPNLAGIAFPPASVSLKGLLTTNPGHIDPGYSGHLHLTVINMGREPFPLKKGDRIMRVLLISLDPNQPSFPYNVRHPQPSNPISPELLNRLSVDFVNVTRRAQKIASSAVRKAQFWAILLPLLVAIISAAAGYYTAYQSLAERLVILETQQTLYERFDRVENDVKELKSFINRDETTK